MLKQVKEKEEERTGMNDKMFKNIMKTESGLNLMKVIIEEVLDEKIEELQILNPELLIPNMYVRGKNVDLYVKCGNKRIFVEINNVYNDSVRERNFSYLANQYSNDYSIGNNQHEALYYCQLNINRSCKFKDLMKRYFLQSEDRIKAVNNIELIVLIINSFFEFLRTLSFSVFISFTIFIINDFPFFNNMILLFLENVLQYFTRDVMLCLNL